MKKMLKTTRLEHSDRKQKLQVQSLAQSTVSHHAGVCPNCRTVGYSGLGACSTTPETGPLWRKEFNTPASSKKRVEPDFVAL